LGREIDGAEILKISGRQYPLKVGKKPNSRLGFIDWKTGTRNFLRPTSKSLMLYPPKARADI
jgi:hypothetical protein